SPFVGFFNIGILFIFVFADGGGGGGVQLEIVNACDHPIWPAILPTSGHPSLADGGFFLPSGRSSILYPPAFWSGRIWARLGCKFDRAGNGRCVTGDCGGRLLCGSVAGQPPATLVEMTLGTPSNPATHFYDVSLVDGFNVPASMIPAGGSGGDCGVAACEADLNESCPSNMAVVGEGGKEVVGCRSACLVTEEDRDCCRGEYGTPAACRPSVYGYFFKKICPRAYSY
ncbi:hypothetical protein M569_12465, partial [Genlisea aurea]